MVVKPGLRANRWFGTANIFGYNQTGPVPQTTHTLGVEFSASLADHPD
jgi:hypothetical protein